MDKVRDIRSLRGANLEERVAWTTPLYYSQSLKELANADVLLVIDADFEESPFLPSKIFDHNDIEAIKKTLTTMVDTWKARRLQPTAAHIEARGAYDVRVSGRRYIEVLESLSQ